MTVAEQLAGTGINLRGYGQGRQYVICPKCSPTRRKKTSRCLGVTIASGAVSFKCFHCQWSGPERQGDETAAAQIPKGPDGLTEDERQRRAWAWEIWSAATIVNGTLADRYLRQRAISGRLPEDLRYHPNLKHPTGARLPALIGRIKTGGGDFSAVQRIWLDRDGRKTVAEPAKATLGPMLDGAVRLGDLGPSKRLGVAEGIETALAARDLFAFPVWACLGAYRLSKVWVPPDTAEVIIFADDGRVGLAQAHDAARHFRRGGLLATVRAPDQGHGDHNDWQRSRVGR